MTKLLVDTCAQRGGRGACHLLLLAALLGCSAESYSRRSDGVGNRLLDEKRDEVLGGRYESVKRPTAVPEEPQPPEPLADLAPVAREARLLSLEQTLELAIAGNRDHKARREALFLQALSLSSVRHSFAPQLSLSLSYLFRDDPGLALTQGAGANAGVRQALPWGGDISLNANSNYDESAADSEGSFSSSASISLTQPLLRGAGAAISHESLIQAERNLVYAIRSFELQRESFAIETARMFYDLVQSKKSIQNLEQNLDGFVFGRRQAEALFVVGRTSELEVLRARRSELTSRDTLISAKEDNLLQLDRFRIFLGLPREEPVDVLAQEPAFVGIDFGVEEAVGVAQVNRLDLLTRRQQLEDVKRGLAISKDSLLPDLSLSVGFGASTTQDASFTNQDPGRDALTLGLNLEVPVDRFDASNAYRRSQIGALQAERDFEEFQDNLVIQIQSSFRELERRRQSLDIQQELIVGQEKNAKIAQLRFEQGNFSNRDVTEAQEALLDARNRLIFERVNYEISRLGLLRELGILFIDEKGMFRE